MKSFTARGAVLALCVVLGSAADTRSPVEKVVNLLKDLKTRLETDGDKEQAVYDKYACWCETATHRKADAITTARSDLRQLGQDILSLKGTVATKASEIETTMEDIKENEKAQEEATALRAKENESYQAEIAEMQQAITALEKAVTVLGAATSGAALIQSKAELVASHIKAVVEATPASALAKLPKAKLQLLTSMSKVQGKYSPQSATITGILTDMYSTMTEDLEKSNDDESSKNRDFEAFVAAKQESLIEMQETLKAAEKAKAEAEMMLAEATQQYDDTEAQMKADVEFFDATKEACDNKASEWSTRKEMREEELAGIDKALEILTSDEAKEMFTKAIKPGKETSFLQTASVEDVAAPVNKAFAALKKSATKSHSLRLARLAAQVKTAKAGHFAEVITAIDDMMQLLKDEGEEDIEKRDHCKKEYQTVESKSKDLDWKIEKNEAKIAKLSDSIEKDEKEVEVTVEAIADVQEHMKSITKERKEENEAFKQGKKDDQDAITLLEAAKDALTKFYTENKLEMGKIQGGESGAFVQVFGSEPEFEVSEDQAPDASFSHKGARKGESKGIVSLMSYIIEDLYDEIKNDTQGEADAQTEYEKQMKIAEKLEDTLDEKKSNLEKAISDKKSDRTDEEKDKDDNEDDLKEEKDYKAEIKPDCDWIMGAFAERASKREAEMEGLTTAKDFLAGYQPPSSALVQEQKAATSIFDKITFANLRATQRHLRARV